MNSILRSEKESRASLGGKAGALADLQSARLQVPPWFVVAPEAFPASLTAGQRGDIASGVPERIQGVLEQLTVGEQLLQELAAALAELCPNGELVAVRSSALDEDGSEHSFAGQLDSFLFVSPGEVPGKVVDVWRSGFSPRVLAYRRERGLSPLPAPPAVLIQRVVTADVAGVAFSADPVSGQRGVAVISGVYGLGTALVSGECDADTWRVDRVGTIIEELIAHKGIAHRADPGSQEGVTGVAVAPELAGRACLTPGQVRSVA
uniref:PEP/pyruvate-binding domain-containing protein n=1 Tax=Geotalea toluenoxydans TaxID=421624 RepID=UPI000A6663A2